MNGIKKQEQFKFSLSIHDKHDRAVRKIVEGLRKRGKLSQSIRDGLRLINDLRRGRTKVLLELFPDILEKLCPPEPKTDDDLKQKIALLELRQQQLEQRQIDAPEPAYKQSGAGIGLTAAPGSTLGKGKLLALPIPDDDDDDDTIMVTKAAPTMNGSNLLAGVLGLDA